MAVFELVIALLFLGALLAAWARRINAPYPALLALAGVGLALLPNAPSLTLDPELALALLVAPVLLDAAFDSSPRDLKENWRAVTSLALLAVGVTVMAVAFVARWFVPEMPWPAAIALGAIVAPPDAAAATAVLKQLRPPHRILVILEGESLFNDASALLIYRLAVGAAIAGSFSPWSALPLLLLVTAGSILLGVACSYCIVAATMRVRDVATMVIFQFISTFAVWIIAERLGLSGIITVVAYAIAVARIAPDKTPARIRIPSYAVWEVAVFVLNVLAFILIGLQLKPIIARLSNSELLAYAEIAGAVCLTVIVVRIVWVMSYATIAAQVRERVAERLPRPAIYDSYRSAAAIAWCGMRGIVTLAAALALPVAHESGDAFPYRDLILFTAFCVVLGTLVLQGMTLSPLMQWLKLEDDGSVEREVHVARQETSRAALDVLETAGPSHEAATLLRRKYEARLRRAQRATAESEKPIDGDDDALRAYAALQQRVLEAERRTLSELRTADVIGDDAFHKVEEELDWAELNAATLLREDVT